MHVEWHHRSPASRVYISIEESWGKKWLPCLTLLYFMLSHISWILTVIDLLQAIRGMKWFYNETIVYSLWTACIFCSQYIHAVFLWLYEVFLLQDRLLICGVGKDIIIWNINKLDKVHSVCCNSTVCNLVYSPDGSKIVTTYQDSSWSSTLSLWAPPKMTQIVEMNTHSSINFLVSAVFNRVL